MQAIKLDRSQRNITFHLSLLACCVAMISYFLAFVSPHWLESLPEYHSQFLRIGLWEVCFDGYLHPRDYVSKAYFGCWYIYYPEFSAIRDWLNPPWYYAVQMLGIVAFVCILLSTVIMGSQLVRVLDRDSVRWLRANTLFHLLSAGCIVVQLVSLAVQSRDRRWMPRPDQNRLGFAYGLAMLACFACVFTFGFLLMRFIRQDEDQLVLTDADSADGAGAGGDKYQEGGGGGRDPASGGGGGGIIGVPTSEPPQFQGSTGYPAMSPPQSMHYGGGGSSKPASAYDVKVPLSGAGGGGRYYGGQDDSAV